MSKAAYIKRNGALYPMDDDGREQLAAMKEDRQVMVIVHAARNVRHHRLFFALLKKVIDGGAWDGTKDTLTDYVKIGVGHVSSVVGPDGRTYFIPRSIDFESMSQDEFRPFFERAVWLISTRLLGSGDWRALHDEIIDAVDGPVRSQMRAA